MRLTLIALLLCPIAAHAFPKGTLTRGVLRIDNGETAAGLADLESIRDNASDADARPKDVAKLYGYLAKAHVRLAYEEEGDVAHHLDKAFADWTRCVESSDPSARFMVKKCRSDADFAATVAFNRAATITNLMLEHRPAGSPIEARTRCEQIASYTPDSLLGEACRAALARASGDAEAAQAAASSALTRAEAMPRVSAADAGRLDQTLAMGVTAVLHQTLDVQASKAMLERAHALLPKLDAGLPNLAALDATVTEFEAKLVPMRTAALEGTDPAAWVNWLGNASGLSLHILAVTDAQAAVAAMPDDASVQEAVGVALRNAAAARTTSPDRRVLEGLLQGAFDAFSRCVAIDPEHPRCPEHLTSTEAYLAAFKAP